jgi:hypothetical protein
MRKLGLSALVLLLLLAASTLATARTRTRVHRVHTAHYIPPAEPGDIYTVIDFPRSGASAQGMTVSEVMGDRNRDFSAVPRYSCVETTPAGVVVRFRHFDQEAVEMTITTSGIIIRGPYQGDAPPETLHHCYQLMS